MMHQTKRDWQRAARAGRRRRTALAGAALAAALLGAPAGVAAQPLAPTPAQPRGPFYPRSLPAESDADLATQAGRAARGDALVVLGRILRRDGSPVAGATVEIWQTNADGHYHHEGDVAPARWDPGFQGWGRVLSGADGGYRFRTIRPQAYPGRTPHIHFAVTAPGRRAFVTQLYFAEARENAADFLLAELDAARRERLMARMEAGPAGAEPQARFDIVLE